MLGGSCAQRVFKLFAAGSDVFEVLLATRAHMNQTSLTLGRQHSTPFAHAAAVIVQQAGPAVQKNAGIRVATNA